MGGNEGKYREKKVVGVNVNSKCKCKCKLSKHC